MSTATADHTGQATDAAVIDAIAWRLASSTDWSADELSDIADLIGTVRPHPGRAGPDTDDEQRAAQLHRYHHSLTHPSERNPA
jgi:hypothetical protein